MQKEQTIKNAGDDATLLTLYALAGEECGDLISFHPRLIRHIRHYIPAMNFQIGQAPVVPDIQVRELSAHEMRRAEEELWIHDNQQKADTATDRIFAAFAGTCIVGVARCTRYPDGLAVDGVYVLEEYRHQGFARQIMQRLIDECSRDGALYLYTKPELVDFYQEIGFETIPESKLPAAVRAGSCSRGGNNTCPMRRDPVQRQKTGVSTSEEY